MSRRKLLRGNAWIALLALLLVWTPQQSGASLAPGFSEVVLRVQTPSYRLDAMGLAVPGYATHDVPGAPALPVWGTVVELPAVGDWSLSVEPGQAVAIAQIAHLPAVPVPRPAQMGLLDGAGAVDSISAAAIDERPDPAIYQRDAFYPAAVAQAGAVQWQRGRRLLPLRVFPFQYNPAVGQLRHYPDVRVTVRVQAVVGEGPQAPAGRAPEARVSAEGGALRILTAGRGMVRLTGNDLIAAGVPVTTTDPATFAVSYLGEPVDLRLEQAAEGQFGPDDWVVFYAEPYTGRYLNHNVYWFSYGGIGSSAMVTRTVAPAGNEPVVEEITRTLHLENNLRYMSTISRPKDVDHWLDLPLGAAYPPISYTLNLSDTVQSGEIILRALINGGPHQTTDDRSIALRLNDHDAGAYQWTGRVDHLATTTVPASWLDSVPNRLGVWPGTGIVYPDWIEVTYRAGARAYGDAVYIESLAAGANEVVVKGFSAADVKVYDLRDPHHPVIIAAPPAQADGDSYTLRFWDEDLPGPAYYLSTDAALAAPLAVEPVAWLSPPSPLQSPDNQADYIAIVHPALWDAVDPLLEHRQLNDGLAVAKVDVQQIYDEFSYGRRDPEALRSFLSYAYHYWRGASGTASPPTYVLLVGDGHYDFTGVSGTTLPNLIPPYLLDIDPWIGETVADNRFVSVDGPDDILADMSIGRIPAQTPEEVTAVVNKILAYEMTSAGGDWQLRATYVADNCEDPAGNFHWLSDQSRLGWLPAGYEDDTVYYGSVSSCPTSDYSTASGMQAGVRATFDGGAFMLQWFGHGARGRWGTPAEFPPGQLPIYTLSSNVVPTLDANTVWPITLAYTCWSGYFINLALAPQVNYMDETVGEALLLTPERGSVADLSPGGQHIGISLLTLNQAMTQAVFQDRIDRMGPAVDAGKLYYWSRTTGFLDTIDTSIYFGDPATRLRLPPMIGIATKEADPTTATLSWKHVPQYTTYEVWRDVQPYFGPGGPDAQKLANVDAPGSGSDLLFDDTGAIGDAAVNHFYVVQGINQYGVTGVSNRVGEFDFTLYPGN